MYIDRTKLGIYFYLIGSLLLYFSMCRKSKIAESNGYFVLVILILGSVLVDRQISA
jgi:hypothetical protein